MHNEFINIRTILDIEKWQLIQDELALVTGMAIITVDYKGEPVTRHSRCSKFCEIMRNDPEMSKKCRKCDARGGFEAAKINDIYIYRCHSDIIDAAVPIVVDDKYMGAVMMGQVIIQEKMPTEHEYLEKIYSTPKELSYDPNKIMGYLNKLPRMSFKEVNRIVNMIYHISNYIVGEAIEKHTLSNENQALNKKVEQYSMNLKKENNGIKTNEESRFDPSNLERSNLDDSILKPAIDYIHQNLNENLSLKQASQMCFISPSYFSRLFNKEMGDNFSSYVANLKMDQAKALLKNTDMLIREISLQLGFNDQSYFIKQFKINEGTTPASFRRSASKNRQKHKIIT